MSRKSSPTAVLLVDAISAFLDARIADGLKPVTVRWYALKLGTFAKAYPSKRLSDLTVLDLRSYIRTSLYERRYKWVGGANDKRRESGGLSTDSIRGHVKTLAAFFTWAYSEYHLDRADNPMLSIKAPAKPRPVPKAITESDARLLLNACDDTPIGKRNRAVLMFLLATGCRATGALRLKPTDLALNRFRAEIYEKGDKGRLVAFDPHTAECIAAWLDVRPANAVTVFCSLGNAIEGQRWTLSGLHRMLRELAKKVGCEGRYNPHSFRHGFARRYIMAGGDISTLSKLMGHSSTAITGEIYAVFAVQEALEKYDQLGIMDKLLKDQ